MPNCVLNVTCVATGKRTPRLLGDAAIRIGLGCTLQDVANGSQNKMSFAKIDFKTMTFMQRGGPVYPHSLCDHCSARDFVKDPVSQVFVCRNCRLRGLDCLGFVNCNVIRGG